MKTEASQFYICESAYVYANMPARNKYVWKTVWCAMKNIHLMMSTIDRLRDL